MPLSRFLGDPAAAARTAQDAVAAIYANPPKSGGAPFDPYSVRYANMTLGGGGTNPWNFVTLLFTSTTAGDTGVAVPAVENIPSAWDGSGATFTPSLTGRWLIHLSAQFLAFATPGTVGIAGQMVLNTGGGVVHPQLSAVVPWVAGDIPFEANLGVHAFACTSRIVHLASGVGGFSSQVDCQAFTGAANNPWDYSRASTVRACIGLHYVGP